MHQVVGRRSGFVAIDGCGRYWGEHSCNLENPYLCVVMTRQAKERAQSVAFTTSHPAYVIYRAWDHHLTAEERAEVDASVPGNGLIA